MYPGMVVRNDALLVVAGFKIDSSAREFLGMYYY
jgi:hypothetical protein